MGEPKVEINMKEARPRDSLLCDSIYVTGMEKIQHTNRAGLKS